MTLAAKRTAEDNTFDALSKSWMTREGRRKQWTNDYRDEVQGSIDRNLVDLKPLPVTTIRAALVDRMPGARRAVLGLMPTSRRRFASLPPGGCEKVASRGTLGIGVSVAQRILAWVAAAQLRGRQQSASVTDPTMRPFDSRFDKVNGSEWFSAGGTTRT